jgi:hypothetical protein
MGPESKAILGIRIAVIQSRKEQIMKRLALITTIILFNILTAYFLSHANDNIIFGCYKKNGGQLRIVSQESKCLSSEVPISWNQAGSPGTTGPNDGNDAFVTVRQIEPDLCTNGYGWCPNGFSKWFFHIQDPTVNESSVVAINIVNPLLYDYRCEVATKGVGEFQMFCIGYDYVRPEAILQYAVFNP